MEVVTGTKADIDNNKRIMIMSNSKNIVIKNAKIRWPKVYDAVQNYNKDGMEWCFDLEVTDKQLEALYKEGMSAMTKAKEVDGVKYISFKKPTVSKKGKEMKPIRVIGRNKEPLTALIGNGSVVNAVISIFPPTKSGYAACLRPEAIQVVDLVEYSSEGSSVDDLFDDLEPDSTSDEFDDAEFI